MIADRIAVFLRTALLTALACGTAPLVAAQATGDAHECVECHEDVQDTSTAHPDVTCSECHTNVTEEHEDDDLEPLTDEESCGECHARDLRTVGRSVHDGEAACSDCHGDAHNLHLIADPDSAVSRVNQIKSCGDCHAEDDPELIAAFIDSVHGEGLLKAGLAGSASCVDCHGAHNMKPVDDASAPTSHGKSPDMCGTCHSLLLTEWTDNSAHGMAWSDDDEDGPVCITCHESHGVAQPATDPQRLATAENCGSCHADYLASYRRSFHGKANRLGMVDSAVCADCHTAHTNLPADNPMSSVHPDNLIATCGTCHEGATASFVSFQPHVDPTDPDDDFNIYLVYILMTGLLVGVFLFFGMHDILWLQRSLVGALRGEFEHEAKDGQYVRRFSTMDIRLHLTIVVTFLALALTGLPLKFDSSPWAQTLIGLLGGVEASTLIHRIAGVGTFAYAIYHLGDLFVRWAIRRERGMFWGPNSMVPQPRDVMDVLRNLRYFLYLGPRPANDRWNYIEKFDYLAVFWGVLIIGVSGLFLWFPLWFANFVPGWVINAAYVVHSDEALLATGFIFFFHFFHTHLRPESFPMDTVIFTGKMSLDRFRSERPLEYQRLVDNHELDDYLVDPPTPAERRRAYFWGTIFLSIGLLLAAGIVWALLSHWMHVSDVDAPAEPVEISARVHPESPSQ